MFSDSRGIRHRSNRPHGDLPTKNMFREMMEEAERVASTLARNTEVIGITLGGGLSRGYADGLSEIDLNIYVEEEWLPKWNMGGGPMPQGDYLGDSFHMDVDFLSYEEEWKREWDLSKKWDASYQRILHDPGGKIARLLDEKDIFTADEKHRLAFRGYLDCVYFGDIAVRQWIIRGDPLVANQMINSGILSLIKLLFLVNDEYPPFDKWLMNYSYSLLWKPKDWRHRLESLAIIKEITLGEAERRRKEFMGLYHEIWGRIVGEEYKSIGLIELETLEILNYIIENSPAVETFRSLYGEKPLSSEVLFKLAGIATVDGKRVIRFNKSRFMKAKENGFHEFLEWNRAILNRVELR